MGSLNIFLSVVFFFAPPLVPPLLERLSGCWESTWPGDASCRHLLKMICSDVADDEVPLADYYF